MVEHVEEDASAQFIFGLIALANYNKQIIGISRSHIRKEVKRELDIQALTNEHHKHQIHVVVPGQTIKAADKVKDVRKAGVVTIREKNYLEDQYEKRAVYFRYSSTLQEPVYIPTAPPSPTLAPAPSPVLVPSPSPALAPRETHSVSPIDLDPEDIVPRSIGTASPLDEDGVAPQSDDPAVESLAVGMAGIGLGGVY
ncbi:hypothetical protein FRC09_014245 [Ceratobasidium sp. 395]|nr:hypothetical protein FRC09_014245 [Ceratobasidium sp. 395]